MKYALVEEQSTPRTSPLDSCSVQHLNSDVSLVEALEEFEFELELVGVLLLEKIDETRSSEAPMRKTSGAG